MVPDQKIHRLHFHKKFSDKSIWGPLSMRNLKLIVGVTEEVNNIRKPEMTD